MTGEDLQDTTTITGCYRVKSCPLYRPCECQTDSTVCGNYLTDECLERIQ